MLQASSSGRCIFILLNFEKLEMHLHALESWRCIIMCWKARGASGLGIYLHPLSFEKSWR
jgi:hypothetical protein